MACGGDASRGDQPATPPLEELLRRISGARPPRFRGATSWRSAPASSSIRAATSSTNNHVVGNADKITVILQDNSRHPAKVIGRDEKTDLALLKIDADEKLPFVDLGRQRPGQGRRLGRRGRQPVRARRHGDRRHHLGARAATSTRAPTTTSSRSTPRSTAAIPAARPSTCTGEVIGINTAIYSPSGGSVGIGFAIPVQCREDRSSSSCSENGHVTRGWLGVAIQSITPTIAKSLGLDPDAPTGALVASVTPTARRRKPASSPAT